MRCAAIAAMFRRALLLMWFASAAGSGQMLGSHPAIYDARGSLQPWTSWADTVDREMAWYQRTPREHGYPRFVFLTFMDGDYRASRRDTIPAMQNGMGIISYLKYYRWRGRRDPAILNTARAMGDYLIRETLTPDAGKYPRFTRSTGWRDRFPQPDDCGSQADRPYEIEPDKGGIAGYALALLYEETKDQRYLDQALQNARVLAANMGPGTASQSPWPFRADYRSGEPRGRISSNMSFILRLYDRLSALGYTEFAAPRAALWTWIRDVQIPSAAKDGALFVQFHEDYALESNRNAWAPLNLARYLVESREKLDPEWREHARALIDFVLRTFTSVQFGVTVCGEQDDDKSPWGGVLATFGGVLAKYAAASGDASYKGLAWQAITLCLYAVDSDGCPRASLYKKARGGWQEDAHTDVIHNVLDAIDAFPEWGK